MPHMLSPLFVLFLLRLAAHSAWARKGAVALLVLSIAATTVLLLGVDTLRQSARSSFSQAVSGVDLIVGAPSSPVSLLLSSVFYVGGAGQPMPYAAFERIRADPRVAHALPLAFGDHVRGFPVVGTQARFFTAFRYGQRQALRFTAGQAFVDYAVGMPANTLFQAVLGAEVARHLNKQMGDTLALGHGTGMLGKGHDHEHKHEDEHDHKPHAEHTNHADHGDKPYTVVGILQPTGTPVDRAVYVGLPGLEALHIDWQAGAPVPGLAVPSSQVTKFNLQPQTLSAVLVSLHSRALVFNVQQGLQTGGGVKSSAGDSTALSQAAMPPLAAILPGLALDTLWQQLAVFETVLWAVSALVAVVSVLGLLAVLLLAMQQRRREFAVLRSVGLSPLALLGLVVAEALVVLGAGLVLGLLLCSAVGVALGPYLALHWGLVLLPWWQANWGLGAVCAYLGLGLLCTAWPAWQAYRQQLHDGLLLKVL